MMPVNCLLWSLWHLEFLLHLLISSLLSELLGADSVQGRGWAIRRAQPPVLPLPPVFSLCPDAFCKVCDWEQSLLVPIFSLLNQL